MYTSTVRHTWWRPQGWNIVCTVRIYIDDSFELPSSTMLTTLLFTTVHYLSGIVALSICTAAVYSLQGLPWGQVKFCSFFPFFPWIFWISEFSCPPGKILAPWLCISCMYIHWFFCSLLICSWIFPFTQLGPLSPSFSFSSLLSRTDAPRPYWDPLYWWQYIHVSVAVPLINVLIG